MSEPIDADRVLAELAELRKEVALLRDSVGNTAVLAAFEQRPHVHLGEGCKIGPGVRIMADDEAHAVTLGHHVSLYRGNEICGPVTIGALSYINRDGYVRSGTVIGERVSIGPFVRLVTDNHDMGPSRQRAGRFHTVPLTIEDGVWIGAGATVIGGVTVGAGSVIAAGAVVVRDVPPNTLVAGVPARVVKHLDGSDVGVKPARGGEALRPALVAACVLSGASPQDAEVYADRLLADAPDATAGELVSRARHLSVDGAAPPPPDPEPPAQDRRWLRGWPSGRRRSLRT